MGRASVTAPHAWLSAGLLAAALTGCAKPPAPPLYLWEDFPRQQYQTLLRTDSGPDAAQVAALQAQAEKARATGTALPPGFRAHLGMLHLRAGNADEARQLWQAEKLAFPESTPYMDQLLKRLDGPGNGGKASS